MSLSIEQLSSGFSFETFKKADDFKKRLLFTILALVVYRIGAYLPLPGVDSEAMKAIASQHSSGILGFLDKFSGGSLGRMTIFALGVIPYISSSIIVQLASVVFPRLEILKKEGEAGRRKMNQYIRCGTIILTGIQGWGILVGLESLPGNPIVGVGSIFMISGIITLIGGTIFLMWLGEQITKRGIGNGISLIIYTGIIVGIPHAAAEILELGRLGTLSIFSTLMIIVLLSISLAFVSFVERAQRRIPIQYPKRVIGHKQFGGHSTHMPLKLNTAGVIPPIFASSFLAAPLTVTSFRKIEVDDWITFLVHSLDRGGFLYLFLYTLLIIFFSFFYTSIVFNPGETADNLKRAGAVVPGYRPGQNTSECLDYILTRLTVIGSLYLSSVCIIPEMFILGHKVGVFIGGTSLLIVVSVTIDTLSQAQSYLLAYQYQGLIRKTRAKEKK